VWNGRIGVLAALIAQSDLYVGYDSAGQHIAAALGVPCIDVFAGFSSSRMLERWRPFGKAETRVVVVDSLRRASAGEVLASVLRHANDLLK
jgi:ADP-heptose:LPS heptosyltransferase